GDEALARNRTPHGEGDQPAHGAAQVVDRMANPEDRIGWIVESDEEPTAWTQHVANRGESRPDVPLVVEGIERRGGEHQVEGSRTEAESARVGGAYGRLRGVAGGARDVEDAWRHVHEHPAHAIERAHGGTQAARLVERVGLERPTAFLRRGI